MEDRLSEEERESILIALKAGKEGLRAKLMSRIYDEDRNMGPDLTERLQAQIDRASRHLALIDGIIDKYTPSEQTEEE